MVQSNRSDGGDAPGDSPGTGDFDHGWRELLVDHLDLPRVDAESPAKTELRRATRAVHVRQQAYVDEMVRKRGYTLDYRKVMAAQDCAVLQATTPFACLRTMAYHSPQPC